ncbi:hypothetical protein [Abyssibacter sp.]|uniref:hypothetical protein n=1 Tax=Abyssibacter sp. TaxID=2320200 RepID=UPI003515430B
MAVDVPPSLPPQQGSAQTIQSAASGSAYDLTFDGFTIRVVDDSVLGQEAAAGAVDGAEDLSAAVRVIGRAAYLQGYPASQLTYARQGNTVFVHLAPGRIDSVAAPEALTPYFKGLTGESPRDTQLEPRRALASLHSNRAGRDYSMSLDDNQLTVTERDSDRPAGEVYLEIGNPGNRFVGRHFLDVMVKGGTEFGGEFTGFGRSALVGLNEADQSDDFAEHLLSYSQVTRFGVFTLAGHRVGYDQVVLDTPLEAELLEGEVSWLYPVFADFSSRMTTFAKVERTHKETDIQSSGTLVQKEIYTSAEIAIGYTKTWLTENGQFELESNLAGKQGFGDDDEPLTFADLGYLLVRPTLRGRYLTDGHTFTAEVFGQWTEDAVPEQQQWVLGGTGSLYSSLPGLAVGDSGAVARVQWEPPEYSFNILQVGLKTFAEYGITRFEDNVGGRDTDDRSQADVGAEITGKLPWGLEAAIGSAIELTTSGVTDAAEEDADANYYFRVRQTF